MVALLLIGGISVFVVIGIKKAQEENREIAQIQKATLEAVKECVSVMKEVRDKLQSDKQ
jgi:large-conductance mechanosensitive channel